jgi:hypothetical protein
LKLCTSRALTPPNQSLNARAATHYLLSYKGFLPYMDVNAATLQKQRSDRLPSRLSAKRCGR